MSNQQNYVKTSVTTSQGQPQYVTQNQGGQQYQQGSYKSGEVYQSNIVGQIKHDAFHQQGHHKRPLGKDLDVVCFLLSIEVERLYEESHGWKSKYEQLQSQNLDRNHYDTHIAELTQQLDESEGQRNYLESQLKNFQGLLVQKDQEIDDLRKRNYEQDQEIKRQQIIISQQGDLERRIQELQKEVTQWRQIAGEREEKCVLMAQEVERITMQSRKFEAQCDTYLQKIKWQENEIARLNDIINQLQQKHDDEVVEKRKHAGRAAKHESDLGSLSAQFQDLQNRYNELLKRVEYLTPFEGKCKQFEEKFVLQSAEIQNLINKNEDANKYILQLQQEIANLKKQVTQYKSYEAKLMQLENDLNFFKGENAKLQQQISELLRSVEEWKQKYYKSDQEYQKFRGLHEQEVRRREELDRILLIRQKELEESKNQYSLLVVQFREMEQKMANSENKIVQLTMEIERLNNLIKGKLQEIENLKQDNQNLYNELQQWKSKESYILEMEQKLSLLTTEVQNLRNQLNSKSAELEDYKQKWYQADSQRKQLEERVRDLENRASLLATEVERQNTLIVQRDKEINDLKAQIAQLRSQCQQFEGQISILRQQIADLENALRRSSEEVSSWKERCMQLQTTVTEYSEMESMMQSLDLEIERLKKEKSDLERLNQQLQQHYVAKNTLEEKVGDLTVQVVLQMAEIESLRMRVKDKEREVDEVRRSSLQPIRQSVAQRMSKVVTTTNVVHQMQSSQSGQQQQQFK